MTTQEFIQKSCQIHGNKYDYSKVKYVNSRTKVCIICHKKDKNGNEHGEFWQPPHKHIGKRTQGCKKCANEENGRRHCIGTNIFIERSKKIHGDKYDYSKVKYKRRDEKVCIICPIHGEFLQTPNSHLSGYGCRKCSVERNPILKTDTKEQFIKKAKKRYGNKYDYSKVKYINSYVKVCIICPEHGEFWVTPNTFLRKSECRKCVLNKIKERKCIPFNVFLERAYQKHGHKYIYDESSYIDYTTKTRIICPEHGEFWQLPTNHINKEQGCKKCNNPSNLEKKLRKVLLSKSINFIEQFRLDFTKHERFYLWADFYLPEYKTIIECQGIQHFQPVDRFGGVERFKDIQKNDLIKKTLCEKNNLSIMYYTNLQEFETFLGEKLYKNIDDLLNNLSNLNIF